MSDACAADFQAVRESLESACSLLLLTHARPDGDGLGSMVALAQAARASGRTAHLLSIDPPPEKLAFLFAGQRPAAAGAFDDLADAAERIVVLDTATRNQLDALADGVVRRRQKVVVIDHHATADDLAERAWIDPTAAAVGVMVGELLDALAWPVDPQAAEALATAIVTDTGWLRFANTDARTLAATGRWWAAGVRPDHLYRKLYQNERVEKLKLTARLLDSLELHAEGRVAAMVLTREDFRQTGANPADTENLVNEALRIGTVDTAILLSDPGSGQVRVSLRSRDAVNVAEVARGFGGGGHARAAGCRGEGDIEPLKTRLIAACAAAMESSAP